jgi:hypothetical protein
MEGLTNSFLFQIKLNLYLYRFEYDVYRYDYDLLLSRNETNEDIQRQYQHSKQCYEKSKDDVTIKLKLLDENRVSNC